VGPVGPTTGRPDARAVYAHPHFPPPVTRSQRDWLMSQITSGTTASVVYPTREGCRTFFRCVRSVDLAVYLAGPELARFRVIVGVDHSIHVVQDVIALGTAIRSRAIDVVVIDPQAPGLGDMAALGPLIARHPGVPIILYAALTAEAMRRTLALAGIGVRHVVLRGHDDQPTAFRATIERARASTLTEHVLARLAPSLSRLPPALAAAIRLVFRAPQRARNALGLARLAGIPARTCSRAFARAGLATTHSFVCAAHVLRGYHYLRGGDERVADVALRLGYRTPETLVINTLHLTHKRPTDLARTVGPEALVTLVVEFLIVRPARPRKGGRRPRPPSPPDSM
jgi:AraC-like DNA-binding protein